MTDVPKILRLHEVLQKVRCSKSGLYKWIREQRFPQPHKNGAKFSYWLESEVNAYILGTWKADGDSHE